MLISIVTPSYNQGRYLEETIQSVLSQDYPQIEYLILDGGSTDGTIEILHKYEDRLAGWVSEKDQGQTDAINKGFARAKGEILAWLNSDDTYEPGAVAAAVKYLQEYPEVGMVYGDCNYINETGDVIGKFPSARTNYRLLRRGYTHIPQQTMFFRAELWKQVGPLDPSFYFAMDYDLWTRMAARTEIRYVPQTWANFRLHTSGKTILADDRCWPEMMRVHYRDGGSFFSVLVAKYYLRRVLAPMWNRRKRRILEATAPVVERPKSGDFGVRTG
ncbi:MAG TPA: glycosyltransferase family 2 protein [Anaerolineales bacterium]|nr:glycosyltransferase family 2 protein [Anaerolineales bacterium]